MNAARCFGIGHALHAVHTGFKFKLGEHATAAHRGNDFLEAALGALAGGKDFRLPALLGSVALVHAKEIAGKKRGFIAAGAGADFKDRVVIVHRVFRQQCQPDLLRQLFLAVLQFMPLKVGELAHFCVCRGVVDERREFGDLPVGGAIGFDRFDDGAELGEFARQLDVSVGTQAAGELAFHQRMAGEQGVQFLLGQDGQSCNPSVAAKPSSLWRIDTLPTGWDASSPHSVTGLLCFFAVSTMSLSARRTGAERGSNRSDTRGLPRSAAYRNCIKSLEPTERKSTRSSNSLSWNRSEGTSSMAPISTRSGSSWPCRRRWVNSTS